MTHTPHHRTSLLVAAAALLAAPATTTAEVTFAQDVAPIVFENCAGCHRPGEAAPFSLTSFDEVKRRGRMIADVVEERYMPPWHAEHGFGNFRNPRVLSGDQIATVRAWVDGGMKEGDPESLPELPEFPDGWQLGQPDLVLEMDEPFEVRAEGRDIYRYFVLPAELPDDQWITAIEVRPSARAVVHHVLFFADTTGKARELDEADEKPGFRGRGFRAENQIGGWAVGTQAQHYPDGLAVPIAKGSDLVLQTHFHPTGKVEYEKTKVGLYFAEKAPGRQLVAFQVPPLYGSMAGIDIPAGEAEFIIEDSWTVPVAIDLINVWGHAHQTCVSMKGTATLPDGTVKPILHLPEWDFNWQTIYQYAKPERLPAGTRIDVKLVWDNSADNPDNPNNPPERIKWGEQSTDEMGSLIFQAVTADESERPQFVEAEREQVQWARALATVRWIGEEKFMGALAVIEAADANGDKAVTRDELTEDWKEMAFRLLDRDRDGGIGAAELQRGREIASKVFRLRG
jgi:hypothetical protein